MDAIPINPTSLEAINSSQLDGRSRPNYDEPTPEQARDIPHGEYSTEEGHITMSNADLGMHINSWDEKGQQQLPEDDGMSILRKKMHGIRDKKIPTPEKARMMHNLMTESYNLSQSSIDNQPSLMTGSPYNIRSGVRPLTPTSLQSQSSSDLSPSPASTTSGSLNNSAYNITHEDLMPTYVPKDNLDQTSLLEDVDNDDNWEEEQAVLGCQHYRRNVKLQCYTCKRWYTCRFCHDEAENHSLIRRKTENMLCMLCGRAQSAAQWCKGCGQRAAKYYCAVCKLWDDDTAKSIYHCHDCGICRIGQGLGKDFFHCKTCSVCMPISTENAHRCIERSTQCDCPICGDYMFTSPETVVFMRCGHSIHHKCYAEFAKTSYRCPICSKSIVNMEARFRNLDRVIESQPMPTEFQDTKAMIYCNDCGAKSAVQYHWLGLKCDLCESYNTIQISLTRGAGTESPEQSPGDDRPYLAARPRSSSYRIDEVFRSNQSDAPSQITPESIPATNSYPGPTAHLSFNRDAQPPRSVPQLRTRAISPVVSNYFGLSRKQVSSDPSSTCLSQLDGHDNNTSDELSFWGRAGLRYRYDFFSNNLGLTEDESDDVNESSKNTDDEDDVDAIDIFGHV